MAKIPVLFVTGHAKDEGVRRELDAAAALAESMMSGPATYLEKPVTASKYVHAVMEILGVSGKPEAIAAQPPAESLREELQELIKNADPEALKEALRLLKH